MPHSQSRRRRPQQRGGGRMHFKTPFYAALSNGNKNTASSAEVVRQILDHLHTASAALKAKGSGINNKTKSSFILGRFISNIVYTHTDDDLYQVDFDMDIPDDIGYENENKNAFQYEIIDLLTLNLFGGKKDAPVFTSMDKIYRNEANDDYEEEDEEDEEEEDSEAKMDATIYVSFFNALHPKIKKVIGEAKIVEVGPCRYEVTHQAANDFYKYLEPMKAEPHYKEMLQYLFPSLFPTEAPIDVVSDDNPFKRKIEFLEPLKELNDPGLDIKQRKEILTNATPYFYQFEELCKRALNVIKQSQVIKVEYIGYGSYGYYILHDCSINKPKHIAENYLFSQGGKQLSPLAPQIDYGNVGAQVIVSELPTKYSLPQITEINSWITHGLLAKYQTHPDYFKSICTNPLIGNEAFWEYVNTMMQEQFRILYSLSVPLTEELIVYRGSPYFPVERILQHSIIATSKDPAIANDFENGVPSKEIHLPIHTRILDLSELNIYEQEIIIMPEVGSYLTIEPRDTTAANIRKQYTIRSYNNVRNKNVAIRIGSPGAKPAMGGAGVGAGAGAAPNNHKGGRRRRTVRRKRHTKH
jgi:hypothetical protein